jgi:predicted dehydrogenase
MVRIAVIGLGYWGPNLVRNFHSAAGENLRICCDRDVERARAIARSYPSVRIETDPEAVFRDPEIEAVAVATPVATHFDLAKAALNAGKSVLVEKPLAATVAQAEELVRLARKKRRVLMVDHVYIYSPPVRKIKELIDNGTLGKILFIDSVRINLGLFQRDVNVVWDLAPHDLSIVDFLVQRLPKSLAAFGAAHAGHDLEDVAYLNLDFGEGLIANFHVNWLSPVKIRYTMIGGSEKSIVYNDLHPAEVIKVYDSGIIVREDNLEDRRRLMIDYRSGDVWSPHVARTEPLQTMVTHFLDCVEQGKRPLSDGEAGLRVVRILDAAQRSIKAQGGRITL